MRAINTRVDWAVDVARLLEGRYAGCDRVVHVRDNLNTHMSGGLYEAFEPERARQLVRRIQFCHTPKHGSWLKIAGCELSALARGVSTAAASATRASSGPRWPRGRRT